MPVCLSVCLSVTFMYCIQTAKDIVKRFSRLDSPIILVFDAKNQYPIPMGTPSAGARSTLGDGENLRFSTDIAV